MLIKLPVIIFSEYTEPGTDFKQFGCDAFIAKPFDLENLLTIVKGLIAELA